MEAHQRILKFSSLTKAPNPPTVLKFKKEKKSFIRVEICIHLIQWVRLVSKVNLT